MQIVTDDIFKAIAHPARREILALLSVASLSVKEITSEFAMSQPAVSQHLRELREANLVAAERVGLEQRYRLVAAPLKSVYEWSLQYRRFFDPSGHAWAFVSGRDDTVDVDAKGVRKPGKQKRKKEKRKDGR